MIGQKTLLENVTHALETETFPHFVILVGQRGSGKKTFLNEVFKDAIYLKDSRVDSVREMIRMAYKNQSKTFIMADADSMSTIAKNAILKVVEECPNDNYFIMTLEDENNTLDTIRSRAFIMYMDIYTPQEITEYTNYYVNEHRLYEPTKYDWNIIKNLCETPGDVELLISEDNKAIKEFYDYVNLVIDYIAKVQGSNAFRIASKVAIKEGTDGYDLKMFLKAFCKLCMDKALKDTKNIHHWGEAGLITSEYIKKLGMKSVNRGMLMDNWILDIRKLWRIA